MPTAPISTPVPPDVAHYALLLDQKYPGWLSGENQSLSDAYVKYMREHPGKSAKDVYTVLVHQLNVIANLGKTVGNQIAVGATIIGKAGPAAGVGVAKASQDIFKGLNLANLIMRLGEIVLGIVLVGVGVAKITGAGNVVSKAVRMA
jgi:hypothetical protein